MLTGGPGPGGGEGTLPPIDMSEAEHCDFIAEPSNPLCLLPFPNDYYTVPDSGSPSGRRIDLSTQGMPANVLGQHIDAAPYNASDFAAGHRYVVALRDLRNAAGKRIEAPAAFRYYRDRVPSKQPQINERRKHFRGIFKVLRRAGISQRSLYLAWDFTVASDINNAGRELAMRDDAFAQLGDTDLADPVPQGSSPSFLVTGVEDNPNPGEIARRIKGTVMVPCYLFPSCAPDRLLRDR